MLEDCKSHSISNELYLFDTSSGGFKRYGYSKH